MKLPCRTFCDRDLDVALERVVAAARHVSSRRHAPLGGLDRSRREHERSAVRTDFRASIPPTMTFLGGPVTIGGEPLGDLYLTETAGRGVRGVAVDRARPYTGLKSRHSESRRTMGALAATMPLARAGGGEIDLEVILGPLAKRARAVMSAGTPTIGREHDWTGASG